MQVDINTWSEFKSLLDGKYVSYNAITVGAYHKIFFNEGSIVYVHMMKKKTPATADQLDFETNYLPSANGPSDERYAPRLLQSTSDISLQSNDTVLMSIAGNGKVDFISLRFSKKNVDLGIFIDGIEQYRIDLENFKDQHGIDDGLEKGDLVGTDGDKEYREVFISGADFRTSFQIKAKKTGSSPKFLAGLIKHRLKI